MEPAERGTGGTAPDWLQRLVRLAHGTNSPIVVCNYDTLVEAVYVTSCGTGGSGAAAGGRVPAARPATPTTCSALFLSPTPAHT